MRRARSCASTWRRAAWAEKPGQASTNTRKNSEELRTLQVFACQSVFFLDDSSHTSPLPKQRSRDGNLGRSRSLRILLVDDDAPLRTLLRTTFEVADVEVFEADGAAAARRSIRA